jgi:serine protease Do
MRIFNLRHNRASSHYTVVLAVMALLFLTVSLPVFAQDVNSIAALRQMGKAFATIAEKASPAVVGISTKQVITQEYQAMPGGPFGDPFGDDLFERFFGQPSPRQSQPRQHKYSRQVQGSGFIVSSDGYILTNNHVIKDADEITVKLAGGREFKAKVIGSDPDSEVAVVKIEADNLPVIELADSDALEVGEWVLAIGNPFGLSHTVTAGIVSAKGRSHMGLANYENFIQTDAAINPGNSGGPLINLDAKVVGINTAIIGPGGNIGIGFAIPINMAKFIYKQLIEGGKVVRGALGVSIGDLTSDLAESLGVGDTKGVVIIEVMEGSVAEKAGLKRYDVVVEFNGEKVEKADELRNRIAMLKPGTKVNIVVIREGKRKTLTAELGDTETQLKGFKTASDTLEQLGLAVQNLTDDLAKRYGYEDMTGVVITSVEPDSEAASKGLAPGMLIKEVNRTQIRNTRDFDKAMKEALEAEKVMLLINDGRNDYLVVLKLSKK